MPKRYLIIFGLSAALVAGAAILMNIVFDPAGIYRASSNNSKVYAGKLTQSPHGLVFQSDFWNERLIKLELAESIGNADCVLIGSSHIMQVSSFRQKRALRGVCEKIINLGVSGASLEDHIALSFAIVSSGQKPKKIIFGIDPWVFNFGRSVRWRDAYSKKYMTALQALRWADTPASDFGSSGKLLNLLSLEYTARSINKAILLFTHGDISIKSAPDFDEDTGFVTPVFLPDASLVYSSEELSKSRNVSIRLGGDVFLTEGPYYDRTAIELYRRNLLYLQDKEITPVFLFTPYHHNVWADKKSRNTLTMQAVEPVARKLARQLGIEVLGAYDPEILGCKQSEFMDFMHATPDCLARIKLNSP